MKNLQLRQLSKRLGAFRRLSQPPKQGWLGEVRRALRMSTYQLAHRMGVSQSVAVHYEAGERDGSITLNTLRKAATALECDLVYALVPRVPLDELLKRRAHSLARKMVERTSHSMDLESQHVPKRESTRQVDELARDLLARRTTALWDDKW
jgi:predicted DNA-binding mobile mystery protein A